MHKDAIRYGLLLEEVSTCRALNIMSIVSSKSKKKKILLYCIDTSTL